MGETFAEIARGGPLLLALSLAALAGLVSFLSPCILPLAPGYLSYVTGLAGSDLDAADGDTVRRNGRVLAGTLLFVAGFTLVFTLTAILMASVGRYLFVYQRPVEIGVGLLIVLFGLAFLGLVPGMQREIRVRRLPEAGLIGAPVFGAVFALSWTPCVGPTLGAVMGMATISGQTDRALALAVAYCLGLGLPFVVFGLAFRRLLGVFTVIRRNSRWVTRVGGVMLILVGVALVTGAWSSFIIWFQATIGSGEMGI
ncbi:cytochrome c biogenesis CcdA family protein [Micromonospora sp. NBC_01813]|uniref:cytochrome c biogenesis CcdA family protein n=1 Tax=Micromonospora sp. NBC_01813 TaxID=2975988 RepID=UPI002DD85929|nr:cytochrome c biogenesis protein CcdA [Micromonospora sp. NBC_01813]WSA07768.1 cytochrome c biogenesis protein CcdA [Micromonospora sp. NBC_01813]